MCVFMETGSSSLLSAIRISPACGGGCDCRECRSINHVKELSHGNRPPLIHPGDLAHPRRRASFLPSLTSQSSSLPRQTDLSPTTDTVANSVREESESWILSLPVETSDPWSRTRFQYLLKLVEFRSFQVIAVEAVACWMLRAIGFN